MLASSGEMTPPWGVPTSVAVHCPVLHHPRVEPLPQQLQHPPVRDALLEQAHQLRLVDAPEVVPDVRIQHMIAPACAVHAKDLQCLRRAPLRPKPIRRRHESPPRRWAPAPASPPSGRLGLGRWGCRAAAGGRRPWECIAAGPAAGDTCRRAAPRRGRQSIRSTPCCSIAASVTRSTPAEPRFRRTRVPRLPEDVSPPDPIHQGVKAPFRGPLGRGPQGALKVAHFVDGRVAHRGSWDRTCRPCPRTCPRHSPDHRRGPSLPSRCSSRRSAVLRPPRTPAAQAAISPSAYTRAPAPTRAAQTGLSCSVPLRARVLRPLPRRDPPHVRPRTGVRRTWPSPRHDRLGSRIVNLSRLQASRDVVARVLAPSVEALDTPLGPHGSRRPPGVCYSALRGLPRRDLHPLERDSGKPALLAGFVTTHHGTG